MRQCEECLDKKEILAAANFGEESKEREGRERDFVGKNGACGGQGREISEPVWNGLDRSERDEWREEAGKK